jgi:hypothetical protein
LTWDSRFDAKAEKARGRAFVTGTVFGGRETLRALAFGSLPES